LLKLMKMKMQKKKQKHKDKDKNATYKTHTEFKWCLLDCGFNKATAKLKT
jgi:hypothetical protein